jgi:putative endonuclease
MEKTGYIYILTNKYNRVLYIGVTSNLTKRISEHKDHLVEGFTQKYNCDKLVYYEDCGGIEQAISREKQIKGGPRRKKIALIKKLNPEWNDLSHQIYGA